MGFAVKEAGKYQIKTITAPNVAVIHYHRAIGFKRLGRLDEARQALILAQSNLSDQDPLREAIEFELTSL